jgi:hypothetical protein
MNLEINHLKDELVQLRKEVDLLQQQIKTPDSTAYYRIQYKLEYFEPIDIGKLLEDMRTQHVLVEKAYVQLSQESDKTFENPTLHIYKYRIDCEIYLYLQQKIPVSLLDHYFLGKVGTVMTDMYYNASEMETVLQKKFKSITHYYEHEQNKILSKEKQNI